MHSRVEVSEFYKKSDSAATLHYTYITYLVLKKEAKSNSLRTRQ